MADRILHTIAGGFCAAFQIKQDGTILRTGSQPDWMANGQENVPSGIVDAVSIVASLSHVVVLQSDGSVWGWGANNYGQVSNLRDEQGAPILTGVYDIAVGGEHSLFVMQDGTVHAIGNNVYGECDTDGLTNIVACAAGSRYSLYLTRDGMVIGRGINDINQYGSINGLTGVKAIAAGELFSVALKEDGTLFTSINPATQEDSTLIALAKNVEDGGINGLTGIKAISAWNACCSYIRASDGSVVVLGDGTGGAVWRVPATLTNAREAINGAWFTLIRQENGGVLACADDPIYSQFPSLSPQNLSLNNLSKNETFLGWNPPIVANGFSSNIDSYTCSLNGTDIAALDTSTNSYAFSSLSENTNYNFEVRAHNPYGDSVKAVYAETTLPSAPANFVGNNTTATSCVLSWTKPAGDAALTYRITDGGGINLTTTDTSLAITTLLPHTSYSFSITSINDGGTSPESSALTIQTLPESPINLNITNISTNTYKLNWTAPASGAQSYKVFKNGIEIATTSDVFYNVEGLASNTAYTFVVRSIYGELESVDSDSIVGTTLVDRVTGVVGSGIGTANVTLNWNLPAGSAPITEYIVSDGANQYPSNTTTRNIAGLAPNTIYTFTVTAANISGASAPSMPVTIITLPPQINWGQAANLTANSVQLNWTAPTGNAPILSYRITDGSGQYVCSETTKEIPALASNTAYSFTITATNASGTSISSAPKTIITKPGKITGLFYSGLGSTNVTIGWPAASGPERVTYTLSDGTNQFPVSGTSYNLSNLSSNSVYSYTVVAANSSGGSEPSNSLMVTTIPDKLMGVGCWAIDATRLSVTWTAPTGNAVVSSYTITETSSGQTYTAITSPYVVKGLTANTTYSFTVVATNGGGSSISSDPCSAKTSMYPIMDAPKNLISSSITANGFELQWDEIADAMFYTVFQNGNKIADNITEPHYQVTGLLSNTLYAFTVAATGESNTPSVDSLPLTVWTLLDAPAGLTRTAVTNHSLTFTWSPVAGAIEYKVFQDGTLIATSTETSQMVMGLSAGTPYYFTVKACNNTSESAESLSIPLWTALDIPANLVITNVKTTMASLSWDSVVNADGYIVEVINNSVIEQSLTVTTTSCLVNGLNGNITYTFAVRAFNGNETTATSAPVTTKTNPFFLTAKNEGGIFKLVGDNSGVKFGQ